MSCSFRESLREPKVLVHWSIGACLAPSPPWCAQRGPGVCTMDWWQACRDRWASLLSVSAFTTPWSNSTREAPRVSISERATSLLLLHCFFVTNICMAHRCRDRYSAHGGLHHRGNGCGFCTANRCGKGAFSSPGPTGWRREEIQRHHRCLQDDCPRWGCTWPVERYLLCIQVIHLYMKMPSAVLTVTILFCVPGCMPNITRNAIVNCAELVTYDMIKELILNYNLMTGEAMNERYRQTSLKRLSNERESCD